MHKKIMFAICFFALALSANDVAELPGEHDDTCWVGDQITGPIWSNDHAQRICPTVCANISGTWTGNWTTTIPGTRSVCNCQVC
ncbi:MAG TPA: mannan-binding protein [Myxococcota bacterium]|nr:mannan-binding protein [Myxococcota bacterium]